MKDTPRNQRRLAKRMLIADLNKKALLLLRKGLTPEQIKAALNRDDE